MKWKSSIPHILAILVLQCLGGCVTTDKDAPLDAFLNNLQDKVAHATLDPLGANYAETFVACELDYNLKYGALKTLNRTDVVRHLEQRKSEVVAHEVVARELVALSNENPGPVGTGYLGLLEQYRHALGEGPEQARTSLSQIWTQIQFYPK
jgi:hypothetical protein